jgi:hypothetical protein
MDEPPGPPTIAFARTSIYHQKTRWHQAASNILQDRSISMAVRIRLGEIMSLKTSARASAFIPPIAFLLVLTLSPVGYSQSQNYASNAPEPQPADGRRHGLPAEAYAVAPGTKFLVALDQDLTSKGTEEKSKFMVRTVEPLEAGHGIYLPAGAEIRGHISRVESAGVTGRAKIYLTFDDIYTKFGKLPIVAEVASVPGDHSVKPGGPNQEGLIEGRSSSQQDAAQAAAAGAATGATQGVKNKDKKEAAQGAALGALTAYLVESGRGHELNIPKGAKLELELERALYLLRE